MKNRILSSRVQSWCSGKSNTLHDFTAWAILEDIPDFLIDQIPPSKHSRGNRFGWETFWEIRGGGWGSMEDRKLLWLSNTKTIQHISLACISTLIPASQTHLFVPKSLEWFDGISEDWHLPPSLRTQVWLSEHTSWEGEANLACCPLTSTWVPWCVYTQKIKSFKLLSNWSICHLFTFDSVSSHLATAANNTPASHSISRAIIHSSFPVTPLTQQHLTLLQSVAQTSPPAWGTSPVINQVWERHGTFLNALTVQVNFSEKQTWGDIIFFSHETLWPLSSPRSKDGSGEASCILTGPRAKMAMQGWGWN